MTLIHTDSYYEKIAELRHCLIIGQWNSHSNSMDCNRLPRGLANVPSFSLGAPVDFCIVFLRKVHWPIGQAWKSPIQLMFSGPMILSHDRRVVCCHTL